MKRLVLVYNPRSTRFSEVERDVISKARKLKGWVVCKFEVPEKPVREAAKELAEILKKDDLVISAGGDGTATMCMNAILFSRKNATLGALPFGNFNDFSETLGDLSFSTIIRRFEEGKYRNFYPLEVFINGKFYTFSGIYFSVGMMAEATRVFEKPKNRKKIRKAKNRLNFAANKAFRWFLRNKHRKDFLPKGTKVNGEEVLKNTTDYLALNGRSIASLVEAEGMMDDSRAFLSGEMRNRSFWRAVFTFARAMEGELPGGETEKDKIVFPSKARVFVHAEGEGEEILDAKKIEVFKAGKKLRVIMD